MIPVRDWQRTRGSKPFSYLVDPKWNDPNKPIKPYSWDDSDLCLKRGATQMWLSGSGYGLSQGLFILIETAADTTADPPARQIVTLSATPVETTDPLYGNAPVTLIAWDDPLTSDRNLLKTTVYGNVVPATQGRRFTESFAIDTAPSTNPRMPLAFTRLGTNATPAVPTYDYRYCLRNAPLAWLPASDPDATPTPEISLVQPDQNPPLAWTFYQRPLEAAIDGPAFSIEPARFRRIATLPGGGAQID